MSNFDTVVLDGEMGLFTKIREGDLPYYTGATEVTPSDQTQTLPTADTIVTSNITINPIPDIDLEEVQVTYTPDEEGQTDTITPSTGYVGISEVEVTVEPIDTDYVGSGIARNDSDDLTASGATITAPAGYYEEAATKTIASGSAATPATTITANPSISVGNDGAITATVSATQSVTPTVEAGYVSSGTAGTITVSGSGSSQLSTQAGATITPTTSQQTAVAAGKFTTGDVIVDAMPSGTAGTPTATKGTVINHSVAVTPSVTNTEGYISGGTISGTAVTVDVAELESGTKSITENGTGISVSGYSAVDVNVSGGGADTLSQRLNNELTTYEYTGTAALFSKIFAGCTNLVSASFPNVTIIGPETGNGADNQGEFTGCTNLESVYFPELLEIKDGNVFEQCKKLSAIFPKLTTIARGYVFNNCGNTMMHTFVLPSITTMASDTFRTTNAIVDLGNGLTSLQARVFYGNNLTYPTIIFRCSTQVVSLSSDNSIAALSADTTIYIPKALYDHLGDGTALDYRAATNWTTKASTVTFACIEGSQYENYYADGTPIPTT